MKPSDLARVVIDTTVQPKAVMFPTDAKLLNRARERLVRLTKKLGVSLRRSYARVGKLALIKHQRYAHAHQFKRANRSLRKLKTYLAVSSATSSGASSGMKICGKRSYGRCSWPGACWNRSAASAVARSIPCTRQRSSASQGQSAPALRVRGQGERRHHGETFRRRAVRHPCRSTARQSL